VTGGMRLSLWVESTFVDISHFGDSQGKSTRGWCSNSRSRELRKVLALRLGCGHIGKGAEEGAYTLSPFTISHFGYCQGLWHCIRSAQLTRPKILCGFKQGVQLTLVMV
jgi:hypothetical protein